MRPSCLMNIQFCDTREGTAELVPSEVEGAVPQRRHQRGGFSP